MQFRESYDWEMQKDLPVLLMGKEFFPLSQVHKVLEKVAKQKDSSALANYKFFVIFFS